jgi:hypothetical protein
MEQVVPIEPEEQTFLPVVEDQSWISRVAHIL